MDNNQFCVHGHDTFITGRDKLGRCKICLKLSATKFRATHKEEIKKEKHEYYARNRDKYEVKNRLYREEHKEELVESKHRYYMANREAILGRTYRYSNTQYQEDIEFKLSKRLCHRIRLAIKNNAKRGSGVRDLGCTIKFFKDYIESKFYGGMTWNNWGKVWELDHIKALCKFDLTDRVQLLEAVHYTNMQPLIIADHRKKTIKDLSK